MPELDIHFLNRTDLQSAGAGETPSLPSPPAIGNAVFTRPACACVKCDAFSTEAKA